MKKLVLLICLLSLNTLVFADDFFTLPASDVDGSFEVSWSSNPDAIEYLLQLNWTSDSGQVQGTNLYRGLNTSFTVENLEKGEYRFRLLSYCDGYSHCSNWEKYSDYVDVGNIWTLPTEATVNTLNVAWLQLDGVEQYSLEMSADSESWLEVYQGSSTSFLLTDLENGLYQFRLVPICFSGTCTVQYSDAVLSSEFVFVNVPHPYKAGVPTVKDDYLYWYEDMSQNIDVTGNDIGNNPVISSIGVPHNGKVEVIGTSHFRYTPNPNYCGQDRFKYQAKEMYGSGKRSEDASVFVYVECINDGPIAVTDEAYAIDQTSILIDVLANDRDVENDDMIIVNVGPLNRWNESVEVVDNKVKYINTRYCDNSTIELGFNYYISDIHGGRDPNNKSNGKAIVHVSCSDLAPTAEDDSIITHSMQSALINVLANDIEPENMALAISSINTQPILGSVVIENNNIRYQPNSGLCGQDTFEYIAVDETGNESIPATVNLTVECMGAFDDVIEFDEGSSFSKDLTENDAFPDEQPAIVTAIIQPPSQGSTELNENVVTYQPNDDNFCGLDSFIYSAQSADGLWNDNATVNIQVNCVNNAPAAISDTAVTALNTSVLIDVKVNDSDADNDSFSVSRVILPSTSHGFAAIENDAVRYTPNTGYCGVATFSYYLRDSFGYESAAANVSVDVCGVEATVPVSSPNTPQSPVANYNDGQLLINWLPESGASYFNLETSADNGASWSIISTNNTSNSFIDQYLPSGSYIFKINACNIIGCSAFSSASEPVGSTVLSPPSDFSVVLVNGDLTVSWIAVENATDYILKLSTDNGLTWVHEYPLGNALGYNRTEVVDGAFVFKVKACNTYTCSNYSPTSAPVGTQALPIPSNVVATIYNQQLGVTWDQVSDATHYDLQYLSDDGKTTEYNLSDVREYLRSGVADGAFQFRVRACNSVTCSSYSNYTAPVGTEVIATPTNIVVTLANGDLRVSWDAVIDANYYVLQSSIDEGVSWAVQDPYNISLAYQRSNVIDGRFIFRVKACTNVTCSNYSVQSESVGSPVSNLPIISGSPSETITAGGSYSFTPTATDADDDTLTFSITGQPGWTSFDVNTGALTGTPQAGDIGVDTDIVISVSDGTYSVSLPSFDIEVSVGSDLTVSFISPLTGSQLPVGDVIVTASPSDDSQTQDVLFSTDANEWFSDSDGISPWAYDFAALPSGNYTIYAKAVDLSNLESPATSIEIELVLGVPEITIDYAAKTASYVVSWGVISGATTYELEESINQGEWQSLGSLTTTNKAFTEQPYGDYNYRIKACDTLGSCSLFSVEKNVNVAIVTGQCPAQ